MAARSRIATVDDLPDDTTFLFTAREVDTGAETEVILVRDEDEVTAWLNYCQHLTHVRLDKGDGAERRGREIVCTNHGAMFEVDTGYCTVGPCEGAYLAAVDVAVEGDGVYLTDADYDFVAVGPATDDDGDPSSTSNVRF